jgi:hypothetical protein
VILNYDSARNIHFWLGERLKEMEAIEKAKTEAALAFAQGEKDITH